MGPQVRPPWKRSSSRRSCTSRRCRSIRRETTPEPLSLPLLDHLGVGLLDQCAELGEHLAPPVAQLLDPLVYHPRWRLSFLRPALLHDVSFFPFLLFLAAHVLILAGAAIDHLPSP